MKQIKRIIASVLVFTVLLTCMIPVSFASSSAKFVIVNPYEGVDWDTWGAYKTQFHCHTNASDGYQTIHETLKSHYDLDYDIVAITDHGTINQGWDTAPQLVPLIRLVKYERTKMAKIEPLSAEEYTAYTTGTMKSATRTHKNGMLDVPKGIELNMATPKADCHLTGYFCDYGQGLAGVFGDYETPSKGVKDFGGLSMLSHIGEYVYVDKDSEKHAGQPVDEYYSNKFARLFIDNAGSSVGMGINSATDYHTRCDRILYDSILQRTIPNGVVPWGFCFSDSHNERCVNDAYTMVMMKDFTMDDFRSSFRSGKSFAVSHYTNGVELNGMKEMPNFDENKVYDEKIYLSNDTPMVTRVSVNQQTGEISIEGTNFDSITWVSNGNVIRRETGISDGKASLNLYDDSLLNTPSMFVRFYITGRDGICYSQPFVLNVEGQQFKPVDVPKTNDISTKLRGLVTFIDKVFFRYNPFVWLFKKVALGYDALARMDRPY